MKTESVPWKTSLWRAVQLFALLYLFFLSIELLSGSFKIFGLSYEEEFMKLISVTAHPLVGLCLGLLITSVIQSSSTTTSMLVAAVAEGSLPVSYAVPMIMGANIGTTVTGVIVAMAHITRRREFQRAYAAATIHDYFNFLSVLVILPLEATTHFLERTCTWLTAIFVGVGGVKVANPLKIIVSPAKHFFEWLIYQMVEKGSLWAPPLMLLVALVFLAIALKYLSSTIKSAISGRVENLVNGYLFARTWRALLLGTFITALVQSSSVTTSLCVPLVAGGIFALESVYPFLVGANIGTTITAILASLVTGSPDGITLALVHLMFNLCGTAIWIWPLTRKIPIGVAKTLSIYAARYRAAAVIYLLIFFFGIPLLVILFVD